MTLASLGLGCFYSPTGSGVASTSGGMVTSTSGAQVTTTGSTSGATTDTPTTLDVTTGVVELTSTSTTTGAPGTTIGTTSSDGSTSGVGQSTSSEATGPPSTTGEASCDQMVVKEILLVSDADVTAPMEKVMSNMGEGLVAISEVAQLGTVTFIVEVTCEGTYALWGRVYDQQPGIHNDDPDSYYIQIDDGPESIWFYGCQTVEASSDYTWQRLKSGELGGSCDDAITVTPTLTVGVHSIRLRNREAMVRSSVAAIARIVITTDLLYAPMLPD